MDYSFIEEMCNNNDYDLLDIVNLMEMADDKKSFESYVANMYEHMIKYKCNPSRQTPSWVTSILNRNIDISSKKYDKYNKLSDIDKLYNIALKKAKKDNNVPKEFDTRPEEWILDNLKDSEYINNFLKDNYGTNQYTFDINEKISSKKKKK